MFVKRVSIEGFKSYRELQMGQELHPGCNLILGQNGCGKSNYLSAIIFALSDQFSQKSRQEKRQMLFEGEQRGQGRRGQRDANTYQVEIVLDNSKGKIPMEARELTIRKSYNCDTDKEDYYLNGKHVLQKDLFNLFESGGFSLSHHSQFQIIQQGEIERVVLQGEEGFLGMLREVTGTASFDGKVEKMKGVLGECATKKGQLKRTLDGIQERLGQLEQEIEEYREIQKVENEKKALELILHLNRMEVNNREAEQLKLEKRSKMEEREKVLARREHLSEASSSAQSKLTEIKDQINQMEAKVQALLKMRGELAALDVENEALVSQKKEEKTLLAYFHSSFDLELKSLEKGIVSLQGEVEKAEREKESVEKELERIKVQKDELMMEKNLLLMRMESQDRVKTPAQRKKYIQEEQTKLQSQIASLSQDSSYLLKQVESSKNSVGSLEQKVELKKKEAEKLQGNIREALRLAEQAREEKKMVAAQLKQFLYEQTEVDHEIKALKVKYQQEVEALEKIEPLFSTLRRLRSLIQEEGVPGFHGFLIDYLDCPKGMQACLDLAGKTKLFSVIVEDLDAAKKVLQLNSKIKGSVINIFPLSLVAEEKKREYPDSKECVPLLSQITLKGGSDLRIQRLVQNFFCKHLLVKSYPLALQYAKDFNLTCITSDLQVVYAGAFISKVGYYNRSQTDRVGAYLKVSQLQEKVEAKMKEKLLAEKQSESLNEKDLEALRKVQRAEVQLGNFRQLSQGAQQVVGELVRSAEQKKRQAEEMKVQIENNKKQEERLKGQCELVGKELEKGLGFGEADQQRLLTINKTLDALGLKEAGKAKEREELQHQVQQNQQLLNEDCQRKKNHQRNPWDDSKEISIQDREQTLNEKERVEKQLTILREEISLKTQQAFLLQQEDPDASQLSQDQILKELRQKTMEVEELSMKIDEVLSRNSELEVLIKKIQGFDKEVFEKFKKCSGQADLLREITEKAKELEKFGRMNRHCVEWWDKYSAKFAELKRKEKEQESTEEGIEKLLADLEVQKMQALERNFKKLNSHFGEIFSTIVPEGTARLLLIKSDSESQISHPSQFREGSQVLRLGQHLYQGIKVQISFTGQQNEVEGLSHLSGGQKAVVAAALLFAILKVEAAPFYIMDEFDNALDAEYRGAIASLIFELSKSSQFLITSFKPELIEGADRLFEIGFLNAASRMDTITKDKAYEILEAHDPNN